MFRFFKNFATLVLCYVFVQSTAVASEEIAYSITYPSDLPQVVHGRCSEETIDKVSQSVVRLKGPGIEGSAVVVKHESARTFVLTSHHVIEGVETKNLSVVIDGVEYTPLDVLINNALGLDLAVIVLDRFALEYVPPSMEIMRSQYIGIIVYAAGFPLRCSRLV